MKYCFASVCDIGYIEFMKMCLDSIRTKSGLQIPFYIITPDSGKRVLLPEHKEDLKSRYDVRFVYVDVAKYEKQNKLWGHYWSHEVFNIKGYDKILFIDSDVLIMQKIKDIFDIDCNIAMAKEIKRTCYNAGVILISKKYLNENSYNEIFYHVKNESIFGRDQAVYNEYFKDVTELDQKWNTMITEVDDIDVFKDVKILHYIVKPNDSSQHRRIRADLLKYWQDRRAEV